nr:hybrid signal transduction histidine kinase M [Tanacetum cinerariifolium]
MAKLSKIRDNGMIMISKMRDKINPRKKSFGVHGLLDGTFVSTNDNASKWKKLDSLVKVWIYGTISTPLLQIVLKKNVKAKDVWKSLADLFHNNKEAHFMELHEELRSLELGSLLIFEYFKKIKVIFDLLSNIESPVSEKNLIMYAVNGLAEKYEHVASIIRHTKTPLTLLETRSMLLLEESRLSRKQGCDNARDTTSSTVLLASHNGAHNKGSANKDLCRNFQRGSCRFGEHCKYSHTNPTGARNGNNNNRGSAAQWNNPTGRVLHGHRVTFSPTRPGSMTYVPNQNRGMHNNMHGGNMWSGSPILNGSRGILGPSPSNGPQATSLPQAFNAMTVQDYRDSGWYMDTGATRHIASDAGPMDPPPAPPM